MRMKAETPTSLNPAPDTCTAVSAAKLNPMKEAWKYRIKKFQNTVFLIFKKN